MRSMMQGPRPGHPTSRSDNAMPWRFSFLLAALMVAFAHALALHKLYAMQGDRPATIDMLAD